MCAVSAVGDTWKRHLETTWPQIINTLPAIPTITRVEFDELKREVLAMKKLLQEAKKEDVRTGQPDCEMEDKVALLQKVAEMVGVDLGSVFATKTGI